MHTRLVILGALLTPALALAQPTPDAPPLPPQPVEEPPPPPSEPPVTTTVTVTPPAPVIVTPAPYEPEYREVHDSYNATTFTTGALVFGATYGASVIVAATSDKDNDRGLRRLYVPLVGPWLALSDRGDCDILRSSCDNETTTKVLLIADGVFQAAGVIGMIDGILRPSSHRVYARSARLDTKVHIKPTVANGPGVAVFGRF